MKKSTLHWLCEETDPNQVKDSRFSCASARSHNHCKLGLRVGPGNEHLSAPACRSEPGQSAVPLTRPPPSMHLSLRPSTLFHSGCQGFFTLSLPSAAPPVQNRASSESPMPTLIILYIFRGSEGVVQSVNGYYISEAGTWPNCVSKPV